MGEEGLLAEEGRVKSKGLVMVGRQRNAMTTSLPRGREAVLILHRIYFFFMSRPITALAAASPRRKVTILGGEGQALAVDKRRVPKDIMGVNPLALCRRATITKPQDEGEI